jgi:hypothetical protein
MSDDERKTLGQMFGRVLGAVPDLEARLAAARRTITPENTMTDPEPPPRNAAPEVPEGLPERWHDVYRLAAERSDFSATYCTPCFPAASNSNIVAMLAALADAERRAAGAALTKPGQNDPAEGQKPMNSSGNVPGGNDADWAALERRTRERGLPVDPATALALLAERDRLRAALEDVRTRAVERVDRHVADAEAAETPALKLVAQFWAIAAKAVADDIAITVGAALDRPEAGT